MNNDYYKKMIEQEVDALKRLLSSNEDKSVIVPVMTCILNRLQQYYKMYCVII